MRNQPENVHQDDHALPTYKMTPGCKHFTGELKVRRRRRWRQRERQKAIGFISNTKTLHVHHTFLYISNSRPLYLRFWLRAQVMRKRALGSRLLHFAAARLRCKKCLISRFVKGWRKQATTKCSFSFPKLRYGIITMKIERTGILFSSDVFAAVAVPTWDSWDLQLWSPAIYHLS